ARNSALAELVRARIALAHNRPADARSAFERALRLSPMRDDILTDAAMSFTGAAAASFLRTDCVPGSRSADLYYARARDASSREELAEARAALAAAWRLRP